MKPHWIFTETGAVNLDRLTTMNTEEAFDGTNTYRVNGYFSDESEVRVASGFESREQAKAFIVELLNSYGEDG